MVYRSGKSMFLRLGIKTTPRGGSGFLQGREKGGIAFTFPEQLGEGLGIVVGKETGIRFTEETDDPIDPSREDWGAVVDGLADDAGSALAVGGQELRGVRVRA